MPNLLRELPKLGKKLDRWDLKNITFWIRNDPDASLRAISLPELGLWDLVDLREKALTYFDTHYSFDNSSTKRTFIKLYGVRPSRK